MKRLIALVPILHLAKLYKVGEEIPADDPVMVKAWIENKAAIWQEKESSVSDNQKDEKQNEEDEPLETIDCDEDEESMELPLVEDEKEAADDSLEQETPQKPITRRNKK